MFCICFRRKLCGIASWKRSSCSDEARFVDRCASVPVDFIECYLVLCAPSTRQITDVRASGVTSYRTPYTMQHTHSAQFTASSCTHGQNTEHTNPFWIDVFVIYRIKIAIFNLERWWIFFFFVRMFGMAGIFGAQISTKLPKSSVNARVAHSATRLFVKIHTDTKDESTMRPETDIMFGILFNCNKPDRHALQLQT